MGRAVQEGRVQVTACCHSMNKKCGWEGIMRRWFFMSLIVANALMTGWDARAQSTAEIAKELAPTGKLRVAVLMLTYFAVEDGGKLKGWSPDLGIELARRLKVPYELVPIRNPADMID